MSEKKWYGTWPANCDGCKISLSQVQYFCDAADRLGHWGLFCPSCHDQICGGKLGTGKGQKYDSKTLEKLEG